MAKQPVRVLQIVHALGMGGAETWLMEVLRLWAKRNTVQMDFLATGGSPGVFDDEAHELGAQIHYVPYGRKHLPRFRAEFRRILETTKYDAIHDHQDYSSGWHFLLGANALPNVRVTHVHNPSYQIRNNYGVTPGRRVTSRIGKILVARFATHIAGTSRQVIREYGFDAPRFKHIAKAALHCGFDPARFTGEPKSAKAEICRKFLWPDDSIIILFAGRIDQSPDFVSLQNHKNSGFAVAVGLECAARNPRIRIIFAGALSPAVPILQQRIAAAGMSGRIIFTGIRGDIERLMLASDALLFPSRGEGLGMVAVEAQAAGLPVLASNAVPQECVVVPELVRFQHLGAGIKVWASDLLELAMRSRSIEDANRRVATSDFAIANSARKLLQPYTLGKFE